MEEIIDGILQGSILGRVVGNTTIISRDTGFGIRFDGVTGYVDFGEHAEECFHSPDPCTEGVTFSMWIWSEKPVGTVVLLDSGACDVVRPGYAIMLGKSLFHLVIKFVSDRSKHVYKARGWNHNRWQHVVWTFNRTQGIRVFFNGCDTDPGATKGMYRSQVLRRMLPSNGAPFVLGAKARRFGKKANVKLDDVYVWNQVLTDHEIWMVYVNVGMIQWLH